MWPWLCMVIVFRPSLDQALVIGSVNGNRMAHGSRKVRQDYMPVKDTTDFAQSGFTPYKVKKGEEYMGTDMKVHFKGILNSWKQELMEEADRTKVHMQTDAENYADPNDRASQEEEFSLELRTRDRERKLIRKIDKTLELIENDDYGYCEACGIEVGVRRLEARPTADQCIDCKTLAEIKERQIGK